MKRILLVFLALACAIGLSGCVPLSVNLQRADQTVSLPLPAAEAVEPAVGDSLTAAEYEMTLYQVTPEQQLFPVRRTIEVQPGETPEEKALNALIALPDTEGAINPFPEDTRILSVERSGDVCVVDLSIDALNVQGEQQLLWMRACAAATLTETGESGQVSLLIGGKDPGLLSVPSGATGRPEDNLAALWAHLTADQAVLMGDGENGPGSIERTAILYYPSRDGEYIAPVARTVRITGEETVTPVIEALLAAPEEACLRSPFPENESVLLSEPEIVETEDGRRMVKLVFDANLMATLEMEELTAWQLYASLTYTITGFVPGVDGLIVVIGDGQLTRTERGGRELIFGGGEMNRQSYPDAVCRLTPVYFSSTDGGLVRILRPLDQKSAASPRVRLNELFEGPASWEATAARVLPDGVSIDDILGVRMENGEAVINLSSNLYRCCQSLTARQEQSLVYAFVNTLTELPSVSCVRFQVEGETVDYLVSSIFLRGPLMRNPGMVR